MANNLLGARAKLVNIRAGIKQRGVTLMELIAGLAVMAVIVVGALALYNTAVNSQRATQLKQDTAALRSAVNSLWMGQGSYGAVGANLNQTLVSAARVPSTIQVVAGNPPTLRHVGGGTVVVSVHATNPQRFSVAVNGLNESLCIEMLSGPQDWVEIGTAVGAAPPVAIPPPFPISPAAADTACAPSNNNTITFTGT